ncbi:head GIN domain-containing protein [Flavobacterium terrae]|uniref:Putative auto-transporter adhesin, head GIN domain n=1 Tax=Flavobacterium terrae TaxID=415425 RepID=A0A1M6D1P6_9FLAO|nr:head GIN domain-containing protein [Flavobacterium terrae]SHI67187.1 Putative auto-transporter adhesin, head GIN domain [Flavobacterium terrae]
MIKLMIHLTKLIIVTCVALLFSSCNMSFGGNAITGSGNVVSKERKVDDFTKIELKRGLDCEVKQADAFKVVVEADDNLQEGIITKVENGTLVIDSEYNNYKNVKSKTVYIYMPIVDEIETTSGSSLKTSGVIKGNNIHLKSSSGSSLKAEIESENLSLESTSGSTLTVSGKAIELSTLSSSGSTIDATNLLANNVHSQSTSGSNTEVSPILNLKAQASSGSSIEYAKVPKTISKQESSGGSVSTK